VQRIPPDEPQNVFPTNDAPQEIEPGVWRLPVPLPFALRSANIYLLADGAGGWTLVDSGLGLPADDAALRAGLARAGVGLEAITALVLTHAHPDHVGLSGMLQEATGAPVYVLRGEDERLYEVWGEEGRAFLAVEAMYGRNGLSQEDVHASHAASQRMRKIIRLPRRDTLVLLDDGGELRLGRHRYQVIWTPGHSDYHMCLLREDGLFIAGDHVLPKITPNIGYYPNARPNPLADYLEALQHVRDLPARLVLPGHGRPFTGLAERVDELSAHHAERSAAILAALWEHPDGLDATTLAHRMFDGRLHTLDDRRFAVVEMLAHLEYLRTRQIAERQERDGLVRYTATVDRARVAGAGV
jgi:glyoxylase-like metal-dependent hydrolase (beta-lactamase superfamily II)